MRTETCVCGGTISAANLKYSPSAVMLHNETELHQAWRSFVFWQSLADDLRRERPTADPEVCDLSTRSARASAAAVGGLS